MGRMVRKQLYIDDRQDALLKAEAERTGKTESALIRQAIDEVYDPEALMREREEAVRRFNAAADRLADAIAESGELLQHIPREEMYRNGRPR